MFQDDCADAVVGFDLTYEGLKQQVSQFERKEGDGFDLTYEGLKLLDVSIVPAVNLFGFDLTYEGLKLGSGTTAIAAARLGFDLTYEGLKQISLVYCLVYLFRVLILPMRD